MPRTAKERAAPHGSTRGLIFFLLVGIAGAVHAGSLAWTQWTSQNWVREDCHVLEWIPGTKVFLKGKGRSGYEEPRIVYVYEVGPKVYTNTYINPSPFNYRSEEAFDSDFGHIRKGAMVDVWFNPRKHSESVIVNRGVTPGVLIYLLSCLAYLVLMWSKRRS